MKNPIILKDILIWFNSLIGKITLIVFVWILSYLFITYQLDVINSLKDSSGNFLHWKELIQGWLIISLLLFICIWFFRWIYSITSENSQKTFELIKVSSISDTKYILWKWISHSLYLSIFLISTLIFSWVSIFLWWVTLENIIASYLVIFAVIIYVVIAWIYIWTLTKTSRFWYILWSALFILFLIVNWFLFSSSIDYIADYDNLAHFNTLFFEILFFISGISLVLFILSIQEIKNSRTQKTSLFPIYAAILFIINMFVFYYFENITLTDVIYSLFGLFIIQLFFLKTKNYSKKINNSYIINILLIAVTLIFISAISWIDRVFIWIFMLAMCIFLLIFQTCKNIFYRFHTFIQNLLAIFLSLAMIQSLPQILETTHKIEFDSLFVIINKVDFNNFINGNLYNIYLSTTWYFYILLFFFIIYLFSLKYRK